MVNLPRLFDQLHTGYQRVIDTIQNSLPDVALDRNTRQLVFGTPLYEHIRCTGRQISPVIELCVYFLHSQGLQEEGLFRIPGSSVKIKKLKKGINAIFSTFVSLSELESDQQRHDGHSCIVSLHDLFKTVVGERPQPKQQLDPMAACHNSVPRSSSACDATPASHTYYSASNHNTQQDGNNEDYIMDVHSIAGLLKLYLRELPEPLFTHALYDSWLECVSNKSESTESRIELLARVIGQLPSANRANLKHLIKFLSRLTHYREQNKMTSTNLAIAMAPSLIWPKPSDEEEQRNDTVPNCDDAQALNQQMCSFGLSASQHVMLLEALINHAEILFPESSDFELSEFTNLSLKTSAPKRTASARAGRTVKSTSPTGLSTASSSSFSSNASNSLAPTTVIKGHSRKGGSMDGLLGGSSGQEIRGTFQSNMSTRSISRPVSVQMRRDEYSFMTRQDGKQTSTAAAAKPPPRPPAPIVRSHQRNANEAKTKISISSHNKPPAPPVPPVPPPRRVKQRQERPKKSPAPPPPAPKDQVAGKPRPVSLRGTGTIEQPASNSCKKVITRPTVPPPERPATVALNVAKTSEDGLESQYKCKSVEDIDTKSASSVTCSGSNLQNNIEEINSQEVKVIEAVARSGSPVLSLDEISAIDDSSFDDSEDDDVSLDPSWTKRFSDNDPTIHPEQEAASGTLRQVDIANRSEESDQKVTKLDKSPKEDSIEKTQEVQAEAGQDEANRPRPGSTKPKPPAKPVQSGSPKYTHSTPL